MDEKPAAPGYGALPRYSWDNGEQEKTAECWKKPIAINPNPGYFGELGVACA
ncbi:MAG: hypothetical protein WCE90_12785 [Candidatus Zixiibacteriota bacterium]